MRRLVLKDGASCSACYSCEVACSETFYKRYDRDLSCIRIGGDSAAVTVRICDQCGLCIGVCPVMAVSVNARGIVVIDGKRCTGCMACADICVRGVICRDWGKGYATKCVACGKCADACPEQILEIRED